jgi:membrane associated rhomboid family serine protease
LLEAADTGSVFQLVMDINFVLFLAAILNLGADLLNVIKFRERLPRWIVWSNLGALAACGGAWLLMPHAYGYVSITILAAYIISIKTYSQKRAPAPHLPSTATKLLIGINVAVFLAQASRGATNDAAEFVAMGALYTPLLSEGEWWRIFTAQFLHWGAMHLAFNMLGLWILGRTVEAMLGFWRYIALYLICGAGGMLIAWTASILSPDPHPIILLGASASVLGLVGTQAAISLLAYRHTGSMVAKAQLNAMTQIVLLQAVFDMMVPEVSSTAHIGGAAVGFCITYGVVRRRLRRSRPGDGRPQPSDGT